MARALLWALVQMVSTIDVAMADAMVRTKFCNPAADAVSSGRTALSAMVVTGMNMNGIPTPCSNIGSPKVNMSCPLVHDTRTKVINPIHAVPKLIISRGSSRGSSRAATWLNISAA